MADLAVAHLPVGQADRRARRRSASCADSAPRARRRPACRRARRRCPGPARREAPAVEHDEADRDGSAVSRRRSRAAAATIARERLRLQRGAADERAVDVGQREQLGGVVGLDRAAVEDPHALGRRLRSRSPTSARTNAIASCACSGVATGRCRSPRSARRRSTTSASRSARHLREVLLDLVAQLALGVAALALVLGLADAEDRRQAGLERRGHLCRSAWSVSPK